MITIVDGRHGDGASEPIAIVLRESRSTAKAPDEGSRSEAESRPTRSLQGQISFLKVVRSKAQLFDRRPSLPSSLTVRKGRNRRRQGLREAV